MPHLVRDYLVFDALEHETYFFALRALVEAFYRLAVKKDFAAFHAVRRQYRLELTQKRCFPTA
jgi:hypothetical protein